MMPRVFIITCLCLVLFANTALACRYIPRSFDENYDAAELAIIGTVEHVADDMVVMAVEKVFKGKAEAGGTLQVPTGKSSCHIRFVTGQKWLYLGASYPSGSILLEDEKGNALKEGIPAVEEIFINP